LVSLECSYYFSSSLKIIHNSQFVFVPSFFFLLRCFLGFKLQLKMPCHACRLISVHKALVQSSFISFILKTHSLVLPSNYIHRHFCLLFCKHILNNSVFVLLVVICDATNYLLWEIFHSSHMISIGAPCGL